MKKLLIVVASLFLSYSSFASSVYFSPDAGVQDQIIKRINMTKNTIDVAVYSFTASNIAEALVNATHRGVKVRVIRDASQSSDKNDENSYLESNGILVGIRSGRGRGIMHDKFAIFDGKECFTGSYNWTNNAEHYNWENALFTDEGNVIQAYQREFEMLWKAPAKPVRSKKPRVKSHHSTY